MSKILLTGAAGGLGKELRTRLNNFRDTIRLSDISDLGQAQDNEEIVYCDLSDFDSVLGLLEGVDEIIHLGGVSIEDTFANILNANLIGTYNIYEAARQQGIKRILFASTNHTIGFHNRETLLDASSELRPDSIYGVSKGYGELMARYYYDKFNIESACVRIGSSFAKPLDRRMMDTWLSFEDLTSLVKRIFEVDRLGYAIIYGVSNNRCVWWDNKKVSYLGWHPKDSSEIFADEPYIRDEVVDPNEARTQYQGGRFAAAGHFED